MPLMTGCRPDAARRTDDGSIGAGSAAAIRDQAVDELLPVGRAQENVEPPWLRALDSHQVFVGGLQVTVKNAAQRRKRLQARDVALELGIDRAHERAVAIHDGAGEVRLLVRNEQIRRERRQRDQRKRRRDNEHDEVVAKSHLPRVSTPASRRREASII
jgi:hypothetical protein